VESDRDRITELFELHSTAVRHYAVRRVSPGVDPDDVVAEVFSVAWRRLRQVPAGPEALPYLFAVARRVVANAERSARRRHRLAQAVEAAVPPGDDGPDERAEQVRLALGQLRERDREALTLVVRDGLSHAEAAQVLGCSTGALSTRLTRARAQLRGLLTDLSPASEGSQR
jgi:RNA polymerase sigma factor (sigma-70 family)